MASTAYEDGRSAQMKNAGRRQEMKLLRGPIPIAWLQAASHLPGKSLHAGLALWLAALRAKTRVVPLGNLDSMELGFGRNQKYRALAWLEAAGLIHVQRQLGRSPIVHIVEQPGHSASAAKAVERSGTAKAADAVRNFQRGHGPGGGTK